MVSIFVVAHGRAPERIRTSDPRLRRPLLYPPELLAPMRSRGVSTRARPPQRRLCENCARTIGPRTATSVAVRWQGRGGVAPKAHVRATVRVAPPYPTAC